MKITVAELALYIIEIICIIALFGSIVAAKKFNKEFQKQLNEQNKKILEEKTHETE